MESDIQHLINFRQSMHENPELAGFEEFTAEALKRVILRLQPDDIIDNIGGFGVAFIFDGQEPGPTVLFRAEMDALPIHEDTHLDYSSHSSEIAHLCGHDGHMAIMYGFTEQISKNRPKRGKAVILFQPAEEIGEGAQAVINDPNFSKIKPNNCFSFHNIPGYDKGTIILRDNTFASSSQGLTVKLFGKTMHASESKKGNSPAIAMAKIINLITEISKNKDQYSDYILATVVHAKLGERTFGNTPGHAEILITLRAYNENDIQPLITFTNNEITKIAEEEKLKVEISHTDYYPTTKNSPALNRVVETSAENLGLPTYRKKSPFPWSEDFSRFTHQFESSFFGLGAGKETPELHSTRYNFPDDIIPAGVAILNSVYKELLID